MSWVFVCVVRAVRERKRISELKLGMKNRRVVRTVNMHTSSSFLSTGMIEDNALSLKI